MESADAKNRIVKAVEALLGEGFPAGELTVRQIALKADVGIGTINYHFQSKEKLIYEVINKRLVEMAEKLAQLDSMREKPSTVRSMDPTGILKGFLVQTADLMIQHYSLYKLQFNFEIVQGDMKTPEYLLPLLKEIFNSDTKTKEEHELKIRLLALQLISTMQVIYLNPEAFRQYSGVDIFNKVQRDKTISTLIDSIIKV